MRTPDLLGYEKYTVTFTRLELIDSNINSNINRLASSPEVRLTIYSVEPVTPKQVALLEAYISRRMKRDFTLIFEVSQVQEVTKEEVQPWQVEPSEE